MNIYSMIKILGTKNTRFQKPNINTMSNKLYIFKLTSTV